MKFSIQRSVILPALQRANAATERKSLIGILSNVLFQLNGDTLTITGTDLQVEQKTVLKGVTNTGEQSPSGITVPAGKLFELCRALPEGELHFEVEGERMHLKSGKRKYTLSTIPADQFPNIETFTPIVNINVPAATLSHIFNAIAFSMAKDDIRYFLNGMLFELSSNELVAVGSDGHRLSMYRQTIHETIAIDAQQSLQFIIPRKAVDSLQSNVNKQPNATALLSFSQYMMRIEMGDIIMTTKLIDSKFPEFRKALPKSTPNQFRINRKDLIDALARSSILSNSKNPVCHLHFQGNTLIINAVNEIQENATEEIDASKIAGADIVCGFNVNYLLSALDATEETDVIFSCLDEQSASFLKPASNEHDILYVIMPIRL